MTPWLERIGRYFPLGGSGRIASERDVKSAGGAMVAIEGLGQPAWSPRNFAAFAREGMMQNPVVYRCVRMISEAAATVPLQVRIAGDETAQHSHAHPLAKLLAAPSPGLRCADFLEDCYGYLLVSGNLYLEGIAVGGELTQLAILRPDRMRVLPGGDGWPAGYEYTAGAERSVMAGDAVADVARVFHLKGTSKNTPGSTLSNLTR